MSLAPERISIKRRRDDGIVDVLALSSSKKQRTSGHYFVRLDPSHGSPVLSVAPTPVVKAYTPPAGVPAIGTTRPGDEIRDFQKYRAAQDLRNGVSHQYTNPAAAGSSEPNEGSNQPPPNARRFHLTRDLSLVDRPHQTSSFRKPASSMRPHLPTFVEKVIDSNLAQFTSYAEPPIDRIITLPDGANHELDVQRILADNGHVIREKTATFQQSKSSVGKTGQSIRDDPATWDLTSDRLAYELMTLALEMDPDAMAAYRAESALDEDAIHRTVLPDTMSLDGPDDFVYETYVRIPEKGVHTLGNLKNVDILGYLVIDDDQEELWDQYLRDEDDSDDDYDEEDADSNAEDNPRNDYPEDEISSDDEHVQNMYHYRRDYSDDGEPDIE